VNATQDSTFDGMMHVGIDTSAVSIALGHRHVVLCDGCACHGQEADGRDAAFRVDQHNLSTPRLNIHVHGIH
jgi:hypothetical protein